MDWWSELWLNEGLSVDFKSLIGRPRLTIAVPLGLAGLPLITSFQALRLGLNLWQKTYKWRKNWTRFDRHTPLKLKSGEQRKLNKFLTRYQ